jgi:hypothetical protein
VIKATAGTKSVRQNIVKKRGETELILQKFFKLL